MADPQQPITLEEGWSSMRVGIVKLQRVIEGQAEQGENIGPDEYHRLYTTIYTMCTQKNSEDYSQQLYDKYKSTFEEYIALKVLPALRDQHGEYLLREVHTRWNNHKVMVRWLHGLFSYLDRFLVPRKQLPPLKEVGLMCFKELVFEEVKTRVRDATLALIHKEREGEQIDRQLVKNVLGIFVEIGMGSMDNYEMDFEAAMLNDTSDYYSRKARAWIEEDSCPEYTLKAEACLRREKERVMHYLHTSSEPKLLERVRHELLSKFEMQLLEKEHSGCRALLRDDKGMLAL